MSSDPTNGEGYVNELDESSEINDEDIVILVDEDGAEHRFVVLAVIDVEGQDYGVLGPETQLRDEESDAIELTFFHIEEEGDMERFRPIEDDETFEKVRAACAELLEMEDEDDEDDEE